MTTQQAVRRWIMTGAVAGVTIAGTISGATLKSDRDAVKQKRQVLEATPEERIAQLEVARKELMAKKSEMERKIEKFHEKKRREKEATGEGEGK